MYELPTDGVADGDGTLVDLVDDEDLANMWEELDEVLVSGLLPGPCMLQCRARRAWCLLW